MGALAPSGGQRNAALAHVESLESKLGGVVDKLLDQVDAENTQSRDRSRAVLTTLHYLNYARQLAEKVDAGDSDFSDDDLVAMPQVEIEKIMRFCAKQLGAQKVKELLG